MVLGFFELPDNERPPEEIWHHGERLTEWFEAVKQRRDNPDMNPIDSYDDDSMMKNELVDDLMK